MGRKATARAAPAVLAVAQTPIQDEKPFVLQIPPPNFLRAKLRIVGISPYVQAKFSAKSKNIMRDKMVAGSRSKKGTKRDARDFHADYIGAQHISEEGWIGIPASSFRNASISACRIVGFKMTLGKLGLFVVADGLDKDEGTPLVRIIGDPEPHEQHVRNATGVIDIRCRPMWRVWSAEPIIRWDADMFSAADILNLLSRVGQQVGIGEGRPDSKQSAGQGWGMFSVEQMEGEENANV